MRRTKTKVLIFIVSLNLVSCFNLPRDITLSLKGDQNLIINEFEASGGTYSSRSNFEVIILCEAFYKNGQFNKCRSCLTYLYRQLDQGNYLFSDQMSFMNAHNPQATFESEILKIRSELSLTLGNYQESIKFNERYLECQIARGFSPINGSANSPIHAKLAIAYASVGNIDKAKYHLELAIHLKYHVDLAVHLKFKKSLAKHVYNNNRKDIVSALTKLHRYQDAIQFLKSYEPLTKIAGDFKGFNKLSKAKLNFEYARAYMGLKDPINTTKHLNAFLAFPYVKDMGAIYWIALHMLAHTQIKEGNLKNAIDNLSKALETIESQRSTLLASANKIGFVADKQKVYWDTVHTFIQLNNEAKAFETVERGKSRPLVDLLESKSNFSTQAQDSDLKKML